MIANAFAEEIRVFELSQVGVGRPETFFWRAVSKTVPRKGEKARQKKCRREGGPAPCDTLKGSRRAIRRIGQGCDGRIRAKRVHPNDRIQRRGFAKGRAEVLPV